MTERSVVVRLRAEIAQHQAAMKQAKDSWTQFGQEVTGRGKTAQADVEQMGRVALVAGATMAAGFGKALMTAADFEKQMSGVKAVSNASAGEMDRLSKAALAAGASTELAGVTASDAARAEAELVKAGVSVSDVLGGALMGSLTLAAAGQLDFAAAATTAAQAMNIFDLRGSDVTHVADVLAAAANKSAVDVTQLGDSLRQGGLVASQYGLSLEDTVGTLAAFGDNALIGSDAGTALKTMLQRLSPISAESAGLMEELGFSAYNLQGNFIGIDGVAQELRSSLKDMTQQQRDTTLAQLFGSDAVRGANILYEQGAAGIRKYVAAVDDQGAAARMAAIQNDNLKGDIEALGGALETAFIENGSQATGALRGLTSAATGLVTGFSSMPSGVQTTAMGLGAVAAAGTLSIGVLGTLYPKFTQAREALQGMGTAGEALSRNLGKVAGGMTAIGAGLGVFATFQAVMGEAASRGREWAASMAPEVMDFDGYDQLVDKLYSVMDAEHELTSQANRTNAPWDSDKRQELLAGARGLGVYSEELTRMRFLSEDLSDSLGISTDAALNFVLDQKAAGVDLLADDYDVLTNSLGRTFREMTTGTVGAQALEGGMETLGSEVATVEEKAKALKEAISGIFAPLDTQASIDTFTLGLINMAEHFGDADSAVGEAGDKLDEARGRLSELLNMPVDSRGTSWAGQVENARDAIVQAEADIQEAVEATSRSLDGNSEQAIENRNMLDGLARDAAEAIQTASEDQTMSMEEVMFLREAMIAQMEAEATRLGLNQDQVATYTGALRNIPLGVNTQVRLTGLEQAEYALAVLTRARHISVMARVEAQFDNPYARTMGLQLASGGLVRPSDVAFLAGGGFPFTPRGTDTVPAMLTPGEFVLNRSAVDRLGVRTVEGLNSGSLSPASGGSSSTVDNSRRFQVDAPITVMSTEPRRAAVETAYELRKLAVAVR